jgi:hypothetical protein
MAALVSPHGFINKFLWSHSDKLLLSYSVLMAPCFTRTTFKLSAPADGVREGNGPVAAPVAKRNVCVGL